MEDRVNLSLIELERKLKLAKEELNNENLSRGQWAKVHVEIEQLDFAIKTLNALKDEN